MRVITRQHCLAALTTICLSVPALTPYFFLPTGEMQVQIIAALAVINAAAAFSCCSIADAIAISTIGKNQQPPALFVTIAIFVLGSAGCVFAPMLTDISSLLLAGILFSMSNLVVAFSEGVAKSTGQYSKHQIALIVSGLIFPLPFISLEADHVHQYLTYFGVVRAASVVLVFPLILDWARCFEITRKSRFEMTFPDKLTVLSLAGFGYAFLERLLISTISLSFRAADAKFLLAIYQALSVLGGVRSQIINTKLYLITRSPQEFYISSKKALRPVLYLTPVLALVGAFILMKGEISPSTQSHVLIVCLLLILANMIDLLSATHGINLTYGGFIEKNLLCEIIGILSISAAIIVEPYAAVAASLLLATRSTQLYIRTRNA